MNFDREAAIAHVQELCHAHSIKWVTEGVRSARASRRKRIIRTPEIRSARSYLIALHEVAHLVIPRRRRIEDEIMAWEWALENAACRITPGVRKDISRALKSYVQRYTDGYGYGAKQAWLPEPGTPIDRRLQRLIGGRYRIRQ